MMRRMPAPTVKFLFDFLSPYAYLAWKQIHSVVEKHGATVEPVPVLFAALLNSHQQKGPAEIPPKRIYTFKDTFRRAHRLGIPLVPPPTHPFNPLLSLRAASIERPAPQRRALIDALFQATWGGGAGVAGAAEVAAAATAAGLDGAKVIADASSDDTKARLRRQTDEAIEQGAFGVPTMLVGPELFWGFDSLEHLDAYLRGEDPVDPVILQRWANISGSASRI
jgi:2-hydroxychromene-2-carboxylate isomerase